MKSNTSTVTVKIKTEIEQIWLFWTSPEHIKTWNIASPERHTTKAVNDVREASRFNWRMAAIEGSMGFNFGGACKEVKTNNLVSHSLDDKRNVEIKFSSQNNMTQVTETFELENTNSIEVQREGWQAILDNFKRYAESLKK